MRDDSPSCPEPDFGDGTVTTAPQKVLPEWIDYNGHMNVAYYTLAFDKAFDDFLENWIGTGVSFVARSRMGPMALQAQLCYLAELVEGEEFDVRFYLLDHDDKRMHVFAEMVASRDGRIAATYESLGMNVDLEARRSAPYPDWAQARLAAMTAAQAAIPRPPQVGQMIGIRRKS